MTVKAVLTEVREKLRQIASPPTCLLAWKKQTFTWAQKPLHFGGSCCEEFTKALGEHGGLRAPSHISIRINVVVSSAQNLQVIFQSWDWFPHYPSQVSIPERTALMSFPLFPLHPLLFCFIPCHHLSGSIPAGLTTLVARQRVGNLMTKVRMTGDGVGGHSTSITSFSTPVSLSVSRWLTHPCAVDSGWDAQQTENSPRAQGRSPVSKAECVIHL